MRQQGEAMPRTLKSAFFGDPDSRRRTELPEQDERRQSDPDDCRAQRRELPAIEVAQRRQRLIRLDTHDLPPNHELPLPAPAQPFAAGVFELGQRNGISRGLRAARSIPGACDQITTWRRASRRRRSMLTSVIAGLDPAIHRSS